MIPLVKRMNWSAPPFMANCLSRAIIFAPSGGFGLILLQPIFELFGSHIDELIELSALSDPRRVELNIQSCTYSMTV